MKKLLIAALLLLSYTAYCQPGSISQSVIRSRVNDTTTVSGATSSGYGYFYWNNDASSGLGDNKWKIWDGNSEVSIVEMIEALAGDVGGGATAAGSTGNVQYKSAGGGLQAEAAFSYDSATNTLDVDVLTVDTEAYDATGWNGDLTVPTKDAVRDKIETLGSVVGAQDLFLSAAALWPRATNGCSLLTPTEMTTSLFTVQTLDFDQTTQEFAQMQVVLPRNWNNGTITATVYWTAASGSGGVVWGISGGAYSNDDALTVAFGTAQTVSDTFIAANDLHITSTSSAITLAGTPADADFLALQISRNPSDGSDTLDADAKLLGIRITLTLDASTSE